MANEYATLADVKLALRIPTADTTDDTEIQQKLTAASRRIDRDTGRRFWQDSVTSQRVYRPVHYELLTVDDISTATGLIVELGAGSYWTTLDSSLWELLPQNAFADGKPAETIVRVAGCWPLWGIQRVRVTAKWGWPAIPDEIKAATILLTARLWRRKDSPEGVAGFGDSGVIRVGRYDPDYDSLIGPYIRAIS
jgi:hypothetical protein